MFLNSIQTMPPNVLCRNIGTDEYFSFKHERSTILFMHANIRSLRCNFTKLEALLSFDVQPDFIALTETWLDANIDHCFHLTNFNQYSLYRNSHGGGISIFFRSNFNVKFLDTLSFVLDEAEILSLFIVTPSISFYLICVYRPPSFSITDFNDILSTRILQTIGNSKCVLCGDFNINLLNPHNLPTINNFISTMSSFNYYSLIDKPTRYFNEGDNLNSSLLDHFWINFTPQDNIHSSVLEYDISDHRPILFHFNLGVDKTEDYITYRKVSNEENISNFIDRVREVGFNDILSDDPNNLASTFLDRFYSIYYNSFPLKSFRINGGNHSAHWMTPDLKFLINKKHSLFKLYNNGHIFKRSYTYFKNSLTSILRRAKNLYFKQQLFNTKYDNKQTWKIINRTLNRHNNSNKPIVLKQNNLEIPVQDTPNIFNDYFSSIPLRLVEALPPTNRDHFRLQLPYVFNEITYFNITEAEVRDVILSFKHKHCHKYEVQPIILCRILNILCPFLAKLYNKCFYSGIYPTDFKIARVIPLFKSGNANDVANFRPISTLPIFSKIFEKLLHSRLNHFITVNNILTPHQYGFRQDSSTALAIMEFLSQVFKSINGKLKCMALFLDLRRAFDTVDKDLLLMKLDHYGVRANFNKLLKDYLSNRKQYTFINDLKSNFKPILTGLFQGSILSPLLFNIFINDIQGICDQYDFKFTLFADDAVFYICDNDFNRVADRMQNFINILSQWLVLNKLTPNVLKTKLMYFNQSNTEILPDIYFNGEILEYVQNFKYLGVFIDNRLTFKPHIQYIHNSLSRVQGILYASSSFLNRSNLLSVFYALGYSVLVQGIIFYGKTFNTHLQPLKILLNNILRTILRVKRDHNFIPSMNTNQMYLTLKIMKFDDIVDYFLTKFLRRAIFYDEPLFNAYFRDHIPPHDHNTRNNNFNTPFIRTEAERNFTTFRSIEAFNGLPDILKNPMSDFSFKKNFKENCFNKYMNMQ